ncbi:MAG: Npun_F0494 family protein [Trichormus sp.]
MPVVNSQNSKILTYPPSSVKRAEKSLICSPFEIKLFETMRHQSVALGAIASENGIKNGYTKTSLSELACDNALGWLIQVGILRREVDGQGITDSFRLTPLGHQLMEKYQGQDLPAPSWSDRLYNSMIRWLRLPF